MMTDQVAVRVVTLVVVLVVLVTQLYVLSKIWQQQGGEEPGDPVVVKSIGQILASLPTPTIDDMDFRSDVVRIHENLVKKFPSHPDLIIKKLNEIADQERKKVKELMSRIDEIRAYLGISKENSEVSKNFQLRNLQGISDLLSHFLPLCPDKPPNLLGPLVIDHMNKPDLKKGSKAYERWYGHVEYGGRAKPEECLARQKVAIVIPYRNREHHLDLLLYYLHPMLQRQQLNYQVFVVEQAGETPFNRGALMNIGFAEALKVDNEFTCFVFHDVDLVPEDDRNLYTCNKDSAKQLAVAINKWKYRLPYDGYFGGVTALSREQFENANGFANGFYGWGGEDDDFHHRVVDLSNYTVFRYPGNIGRFAMLRHEKGKKDDELVAEMMDKSQNNLLIDDGLSSLDYKKLNERREDLYTWFLVKLPPPPERQKTNKSSSGGLQGLQNLFWSGLDNLFNGMTRFKTATNNI